MSEDLELTPGGAGLDRRDFIRRSAIVGGMVWAAPMIQSFGSPAFAFGTIDEFEFPCDKDISNVAVLVSNAGTATYKAEVGDLTAGYEGSTSPCVGGLDPTYVTAWCAAAETQEGPIVSVNQSDKKQWVISVPSGYTIVWAVVNAATDCYLNEGSGDKDNPVTSLTVGCTGTGFAQNTQNPCPSS